jgi:hypothetical protein
MPLQFFIRFQVKRYKAADFLQQFVATAVTKQAVLILIFLLPSVMLIILLLQRTYFYVVSLKRKQALPEGNLSAIRLMHIR